MTASSAVGLDAQSGLWVLIFGAVLGAVLMAWDGITSSSPQKALKDGAIGLGIGAVSGFLGGFVAQWLYGKMIANVIEHATNVSSIKGDLILARMGGWAVFGLLLGIGLGAVGGRRKLVNGLIGGVVGAAVGGLIFQMIDNAQLNTNTTSSGFWPRLIGLTLTGVGIGLAIGLVERVRRDSWVRITSGPMAGKEFILYKTSTAVGRDYRCDIVLAKDLAAYPVHATFVRDPSGNVTVVPGPGAQIAINGVPAPGGKLRSNDAVTVGSSTLSYQERAAATYPAGPGYGPPGYPPPQAPGAPPQPGYPPGPR